jgi:hypothetical protein
MTLAERVAALESRIESACERAERPRSAVTLVAVSKTHPVEAIAAVHALGQKVFGENRVQEGQVKKPALPADIEWHLLGPLQRNKVRPALDSFRVLQAVDRLELATALAAEARRRERQVEVFLEIHLGGESSKHGFDPATFLEDAKPVLDLPELKVRGLMAIPPPAENSEESRPWFRTLRGLRDRASTLWGPRFGGELSMGMSADFEVAIEEGATHIRVGTAIFGERPEVTTV